MPIGHLFILFGEMFIQVFCPVFGWVVCFDAVKCHRLFVNFGDSSPIRTSFANIFSQSVSCLFVLFIVSFAGQKLLSLSRSHLFIFGFIYIILGNE